MFDDTATGGHTDFSPFATLMARDDWPVIVGLPAIAAVFVFAVPRLGWWAALLAVVVYAAGFLAFSRSSTADDTYAELIAALGRLPELDGSVARGHADRTSQLAAEIGRELDVAPTDLALLAAAARCRYVGRVGRDQAPFVRRGFDDDVAARWSHDIVAASPRLDGVAKLLGSDATGDLRVILDVADAYETARHGAGMSAAEAMQMMDDAWTEHPRITEALAVVSAPVEV